MRLIVTIIPWDYFIRLFVGVFIVFIIHFFPGCTPVREPLFVYQSSAIDLEPALVRGRAGEQYRSGEALPKFRSIRFEAF